MTAALGVEMLLVAEIDQGVELGGAQRHHRAAAPAIAAVGAAARQVSLAPESDTAIAAGAARDMYLGLVQKAHEISLPGVMP